MYFICVILFCYVIATTTGLNSRSVNVNLETVLQFDPQDNSADVKFIDNIQRFLGKVKTVIERKSGRRSQKKQEPSIKFTDFIKKAIDILKTYDDDDLKDIVDIIDNEIRKYHYKGSKFHELIQNGGLRRFVTNKLKTVQDQNGKDIKKSLTNILAKLEDAEFDDKHAELIGYINSLYKHSDVGKMKSFLNDIEAYKVKSKRSNLDLLTIVGNGIRNIIFDHYSNLNPYVRRELRIKLESFWNTNTDVTTEATTVKKSFDFANFFRDFTFEFITPDILTPKSVETYTTGTSKYAMKPTSPRSNKKSIKDKSDKMSDEIPNTDNKESNDKSVEKPKKKNKTHKLKNNKDTHKKKTHADKTLASKHKHKSNNHVFRQHDDRPAKVFDYKTIINVREQTDVSASNELWKPDISVDLVRNNNSNSKNKKGDFRNQSIATDSEEGLSIDFTSSPKRRLNLENNDKIFESSSPEVNEDIGKTSNIVTEKSTTVEASKVNQSLTTELLTQESLSMQNIDTTPIWQNLSQKVQNIEAVSETNKPITFSFEDSIEVLSSEKTKSQTIKNMETTPKVSHKDQNVETINTLNKKSNDYGNFETSTQHKQPKRTTMIPPNLTTEHNSTTTPNVEGNRRQNINNATNKNTLETNQVDVTIKDNHFTTKKHDLTTNVIHITTIQNKTTNLQDEEESQNKLSSDLKANEIISPT